MLKEENLYVFQYYLSLYTAIFRNLIKFYFLERYIQVNNTNNSDLIPVSNNEHECFNDFSLQITNNNNENCNVVDNSNNGETTQNNYSSAEDFFDSSLKINSDKRHNHDNSFLNSKLKRIIYELPSFIANSLNNLSGQPSKSKNNYNTLKNQSQDSSPNLNILNYNIFKASNDSNKLLHLNFHLYLRFNFLNSKM